MAEPKDQPTTVSAGIGWNWLKFCTFVRFQCDPGTNRFSRSHTNWPQPTDNFGANPPCCRVVSWQEPITVSTLYQRASRPLLESCGEKFTWQQVLAYHIESTHGVHRRPSNPPRDRKPNDEVLCTHLINIAKMVVMAEKLCQSQR